MASSQSIQPMDATSLRAVLGELRPLLVPSRFEKAQQWDAHTLQIALRSLDGCHWLELSWLAEAPRLLTIDPPPRQGEGSTLAQQLQHGLRGLALVSLTQREWERVVELGFARRPGEAARRWLVLELMGRHSNLFLLDEERRVVALGRQVRAAQSRLRPIGTGDPYRDPPPAAGDTPRSEEGEASWRRRLSLLPLPLGRALVETYRGIGPALARQLTEGMETVGSAPLLEQPVQELSEAQWRELRRRWQAWLAAVENGRFSFQGAEGSAYRCWIDPPATADQPGATDQPSGQDLPGDPAGATPINRGLAAYYGERLRERDDQRRRHALRQRLLAAADRERSQVALQQERLDAVPGGDDLQRQADGLLSLPDPGREQIALAQKLYHRARKLRRSVAAITPRLEAHRQRLAWLEDSLIFLEQADDGAALEALAREVEEELAGAPTGEGQGGGGGADRRRRRRAERAAEGPQPLELHTPAGLRLQVGRNHRQNEWISLRQARRGDLWFHAQECPGSHVVLKASEGAAGETDLAAAADLAAHFSRGRGNRRVPVVMVPTDDLQRIPGAGPGTVRHRGGRILWGEPQRARPLLERP